MLRRAGYRAQAPQGPNVIGRISPAGVLPGRRLRSYWLLGGSAVIDVRDAVQPYQL
jgi:hypothetical protein